MAVQVVETTTDWDQVAADNAVRELHRIAFDLGRQTTFSDIVAARKAYDLCKDMGVKSAALIDDEGDSLAYDVETLWSMSLSRFFGEDNWKAMGVTRPEAHDLVGRDEEEE